MKKILAVSFFSCLFLVNINSASAEVVTGGSSKFEYAVFANEIKLAIFDAAVISSNENTSAIASTVSNDLPIINTAKTYGIKFLNDSVATGLSKIKSIQIFR